MWVLHHQCGVSGAGAGVWCHHRVVMPVVRVLGHAQSSPCCCCRGHCCGHCHCHGLSWPSSGAGGHFCHCWLLAPVIHPMSSGSQGWWQVLGCLLSIVIVGSWGGCWAVPQHWTLVLVFDNTGICCGWAWGVLFQGPLLQHICNLKLMKTIS